MEKIRRNHRHEEFGVALVTTLVITVVIMMLIGGLTYLFLKGTEAVTINKQFSTVHEAANRGVEYTTDIIIDYIQNPTNPPSQIGQFDTDEPTLRSIINCTNQNSSANLMIKTADGRFLITTTIQCLGSQRLLGEGGSLRFPPLPAKGGIKSKATTYMIYYIKAEARENSNPQNIAYTEAVYKLFQ